MIKKVVWYLFFALLAVSCLNDPDCYNLSLNVIGISFKKIADGKADTIVLNGISMDGTDSIFNPNTLATGVYLPLNYLQNQTSIVFTRPGITGPYTNTLVLGYDAQAQFVSEDCGERYVVTNLHILSSDFDSTRLVSNTPTKDPSSNLIIYRCPITDFVRFSFRQWTTDEEEPEGTDLEVTLNGATADFTNDTYWVGLEASTFRLPINGESTSTAFVMDFEDYGNTSITLNYASVSDALFIPCGEQKFFSNISISTYESEFDKVVLLNDSIQDPPVTNVAFYKCPVTNLVKIAFRESTTSTNNVSVDILKITADYTTEEFYVNTKASSVELPLNEAADATTFIFTLASGEKVITLNYDREQNQYHEVCNQTEMSSLTIESSSGFTAAPTVIEPFITFPTVNNIEFYPN